MSGGRLLPSHLLYGSRTAHAPQRANFEFFLQAGYGAALDPAAGPRVRWVFVMATDLCSPCQPIFPIL